MSMGAVEATSLDSVKATAANPPPHPSIPPPSRYPLVLYIARVPGSRDVFLTPIKPRDKVVTAGDIQRSLYYVHVNSDHDYEDPDDGPASYSSPMVNDGGNSPPAHDHRNTPPPLPARHRVVGSASRHVMRKPVLPDRRGSPQVDLPVLPPRPLPEPPEDSVVEHSPISLHSDNVHLLRQVDHDIINNPYTRDYATHPETLKQLERDSRPESGTLTLIRRDPSSHEQWNVATIHDPPVHEVSSSSLLVSSSAKRTKKSGAPLYLDLTNPGYRQFISTSQRNESRSSTSTTASSDSDHSAAPEGVFRRRLYMPRSRYADHSYGVAPSRRSTYSSLNGSVGSGIDLPHTMRDRHHSVDFESAAAPIADKRSKGYTFSSPWNGLCEFTTGVTGGSLKCRHALPSAYRGGGVDVSELRFNLPNSSKNSVFAGDGWGTKGGRESYFSRRGSRGDLLENDEGWSSPGVVINEKTGRIDLSLGRERAGGGFGGKQAKLGKLIIEPEGLKMLDLLVAANMGLWWRAYERG